MRTNILLQYHTHNISIHPQARNLTLPSSLTGLSAPSIALGMAGNALMLPRALFVRDYIWLFGSAWGCLAMGWGQLLSLKLGEGEGEGGEHMIFFFWTENYRFIIHINHPYCDSKELTLNTYITSFLYIYEWK